MQVYDVTEGTFVQVPPDVAREGFLAGRYKLRGDERIPVRAPGGEIGTVVGTEVDDALRGGFEFVEDEELEAAELRADANDVGSTLRSVIEGGIEGATGGATDLVEAALGPQARGLAEAAIVAPLLPLSIPMGVTSLLELGEDPEQLTRERQAREAENPLARGAGEVVGMGGSALAGSALGVGRAAALGPGALLGAVGTGAGRGAEALAARALGRGAARGVGTITAGVVEGGAYGGLEYATEAALGDPAFSGEALVAHIGRGAALGGAGAALFGAAGALSGAAMRRAFGAVRGATTEETLRNAAGSLSWKSLGATARQQRDAMRRAGGAARIGQDALDRGWVTAESTLEETAERVTNDLDVAGGEIGAILRQLDEIQPRGVDSADRVIARIEREVLAPLSGSPFEGDVLNALGRHVSRFRRRYGSQLDEAGELLPAERLGFETLHDIRRGLDRTLYRNRQAALAGSATPLQRELRHIRSILDDELEKAAAAAGRRAGDDLLGRYQTAKRIYESARVVRDVVEARLAREEAAQSFSLMGLGIGSVASAAAFGISPANLVMGFLVGSLVKALRKHGPRLAAVGLDRASRLFRMQSAVTAVNVRIDDAIDDLLAGASRPRVLDDPAAFDELAEMIAPGVGLSARGHHGLRRETTPKRRGLSPAEALTRPDAIGTLDTLPGATPVRALPASTLVDPPRTLVDPPARMADDELAIFRAQALGADRTIPDRNLNELALARDIAVGRRGGPARTIRDEAPPTLMDEAPPTLLDDGPPTLLDAIAPEPRVLRDAHDVAPPVRPLGHADAIAESLAEVSATAPSTAAKMAEVLQRGSMILQARLPSGAISAAALLPWQEQIELSDSERATFVRQARVVEDPLSVLDELVNGTITDDQVEVLADNYPQLYEEMRARLLERLAEHDRPLSYQAILAISTFFPDVAIVPSLEPDSMRASQERYLESAGAEAGGAMTAAAAGGGPAPEQATRMRSDGERLLSGD